MNELATKNTLYLTEKALVYRCDSLKVRYISLMKEGIVETPKHDLTVFPTVITLPLDDDISLQIHKPYLTPSELDAYPCNTLVVTWRSHVICAIDDPVDEGKEFIARFEEQRKLMSPTARGSVEPDQLDLHDKHVERFCLLDLIGIEFEKHGEMTPALAANMARPPEWYMMQKFVDDAKLCQIVMQLRPELLTTVKDLLETRATREGRVSHIQLMEVDAQAVRGVLAPDLSTNPPTVYVPLQVAMAIPVNTTSQ